MVGGTSRASISKLYWPGMNAPRRHGLQRNLVSAPSVSGYSKQLIPSSFTTLRGTLRSCVWPFEELHRRLTEYAYEVYDTLHHPALSQSPREAHDAGIARTGQRAHRLIAYDREFLVHTLPTTCKGTAKIAPGRGIKIHNLYYWSDAFRAPDVEK